MSVSLLILCRVALLVIFGVLSEAIFFLVCYGWYKAVTYLLPSQQPPRKPISKGGPPNAMPGQVDGQPVLSERQVRAISLYLEVFVCILAGIVASCWRERRLLRAEEIENQWRKSEGVGRHAASTNGTEELS